LAADSNRPAPLPDQGDSNAFPACPPFILRAGIPSAIFGIYRSNASGGKIQ
jgi:hypothetical protein